MVNFAGIFPNFNIIKLKYNGMFISILLAYISFHGANYVNNTYWKKAFSGVQKTQKWYLICSGLGMDIGINELPTDIIKPDLVMTFSGHINVVPKHNQL